MKLRALALASGLLLGAGTAQAAPVLVAGWDFSQYIPGFLSTDGGNTLTATLPSNYSDLDNTLRAGAGFGSTQYGTMYLDGSNGSFATPLDGATDPFAPATGNIEQNTGRAAVLGLPMGSAAAGNAILFEAATPPQSQEVFNILSMQAGDVFGVVDGLLDVVFGASLDALQIGSTWSVAFGGQVLGTGTSQVIVEFSADGSAYQQIGTANLTASAAAFSFDAPVSAENLTEAFFRLRFDPNTSILPAIDNLTISGDVTVIPEPGTIVLTMAGLAGLAAMGRRRLS